MFVSRVAFDAVCAARDAEHENAMQLRHELAAWAKRYDDLLARYHEATSRVADIAETAITPAPVTVNAPAPEFKDFPPEVAAALAKANAGFTPDVRRANYAWADTQLKAGESPKKVASLLLTGIPVSPDELEA